jgi:hypothetical protein
MVRPLASAAAFAPQRRCLWLRQKLSITARPYPRPILRIHISHLRFALRLLPLGQRAFLRQRAGLTSLATFRYSHRHGFLLPVSSALRRLSNPLLIAS